MKIITTRGIEKRRKLITSGIQKAENGIRSALRIKVNPTDRNGLSTGRQWRERLMDRDWGNIPAEIREDRSR